MIGNRNSNAQPMRLRGDPTPEQIRKRCREIRAEWSDTTRRGREGGSPNPWTVPQVRQLRAESPNGPYRV